MRKSVRLLVLVAAVLIAAGVLVYVRLNRAGYLPVHTTVTAELPATAVPLPEGSSEEVDTPAPTSTSTPHPTTQVPTSTTAPEAATLTTEATVESRPTRVVPPPETVVVPEGFGVSVFAEGLSDPRMMTVGPDGEVYVAERGAGRIIRLPDRDDDGVFDGIEVVADELSQPSSLAFHRDGSLYVGETRRVVRLVLGGEPPRADGVEVVVDGLPSGGHNTRTVLFSPDWEWLYVSVGSSCNVCIEEDSRRATILRYRPDGSEASVYATGLRNAVGITFRPGTDELWATNNGRDWLGDDQPPETVYVVEQGDDAGWPRCHSGRIVDPDYGSPGDCEGVLDPAVEMQAHSAPLGLGFYAGDVFPEDYHGDLFVAFHGSWNREEPTGYKVVRIPVEDGVAGGVMDFAVGWLRPDGSNWGRPVDVVTARDGSLLVSDDGGGRIYRIFYAGP